MQIYMYTQQASKQQSTIKHTAFGNIVKLLGKVPKTTTERVDCGVKWVERRKGEKRHPESKRVNWNNRRTRKEEHKHTHRHRHRHSTNINNYYQFGFIFIHIYLYL